MRALRGCDIMDTARLLEHRRAKDEFMGTAHSPLSDEVRVAFSGLDYYDPNPALVFTVPLEPGDNAEVPVQTSDGETRSYRRTGRVTLEVGAETVALALYSTGHPGYFIPFRDQTSGKATYGAGRYLDVERNEDGSVTIDFNLAYNPYCAYNASYSCPLPPTENWLEIAVTAGERNLKE